MKKRDLCSSNSNTLPTQNFLNCGFSFYIVHAFSTDCFYSLAIFIETCGLKYGKLTKHIEITSITAPRADFIVIVRGEFMLNYYLSDLNGG